MFDLDEQTEAALGFLEGLIERVERRTSLTPIEEVILMLATSEAAELDEENEQGSG